VRCDVENRYRDRRAIFHKPDLSSGEAQDSGFLGKCSLVVVGH
jgi:hypothetical protein